MTFPAVALVVLDGWGLAPPGPGNAVWLAKTPVFDGLWQRYPHTQLEGSGRAVGLPDGQMGNSEVGHLNLGAGSVVRQDLVRIDDAIADGSFFENEALRGACRRARDHGGRLHLLGLVSDGGVHSSLDHLRACIDLAVREHVPGLALHALTDGRDTGPRTATNFVEQVEEWLAAATESGMRARIATLGGRYWGMDRDRRWERTKRAYDATVHARGLKAPSAGAAIGAAYERGETDEFIEPTVIGEPEPVQAGEPAIAFNFRPDRMRQICLALGEEDFSEFDRGGAPVVPLTTMTRYRENFPFPVAFEPDRPATTIAAVLAERGDRQLHVAETEKYAHVTYFFDGGVEREYPGEERCLVDSPRDVPTYDLKPEMSAPAAAEQFAAHWRRADSERRPFRFGIINFANPDMVGHTGVIDAARRAVETVDTCLAQVVGAVQETGGALLITADHGNADEMLEPDGSPATAHSMNPVPLVATVDGAELRDGGILADVAPTALELLGIPQPAEMTGRSLLR
jgi:2,3-bisphosphoglycerate-independent phosphoglycerate mutase